MRQLIPLFSTPLFISYVRPVSAEAIDFIKNTPYKQHDAAIKISKDYRILDRPELAGLKDNIIEEFNHYRDDVLQIDSSNLEFELTTSWSTKSDPGDSSDIHNHRNSLISGVVYLDVPQNSGNITFNEFNNNRMFYQMIDIPFKEFNIYNSANWFVQPESYMVIFFPSVLLHQVGVNKSNSTRHSLAFNFFPKGKLGTNVSELEIK